MTCRRGRRSRWRSPKPTPQGGIDGHQIKLITADTKSVIPNGASVAKQLLSQGAKMLVVSCDYDFGSPAAGVAQAAGTVSMSLCAQSPLFGVQGIGDKAYTVSEDVVTEGAVVATFARKQKNLNKTFLIVDDTLQYDRGLCDGYKKAFTALGGKIVGRQTGVGRIHRSPPRSRSSSPPAPTA